MINELEQLLTGKWERVGIEGMGLLGGMLKKALPRILEFFPGGTFTGNSMISNVLSGGSYVVLSEDTIRVDATAISPPSSTVFKVAFSGDRLSLNQANTKRFIIYQRLA